MIKRAADGFELLCGRKEGNRQAVNSFFLETAKAMFV